MICIFPLAVLGAIMIPRLSPRLAFATVNAAQLAAWNYYFCPVAGADQHIAEFDETAVDSPFIFLDDATLETGHLFMALSESQEQKYQKQFNEVMGG